MKLRYKLTPLLLFASLHPGLAQASSDMLCSPNWQLVSDQLSGCSNLAFLSPGNDSRVNLQLLLADSGRLDLPQKLNAIEGYEYGYGQVPFSVAMLTPRAESGENSHKLAEQLDASALRLALQQFGMDAQEGDLTTQLFAEGEGSRCRSNNTDAVLGFVGSLAEDSTLDKAERQTLAQARLNLLSVCGQGDPQTVEVLDLQQLQSPSSQAHGRYLLAADAFYRGDFASAYQHFSDLTNSEQPWLKETAHYMQARVSLNQAQQHAFDEYGFPELDNVEHGSLEASENAFNAYLSTYPQGRYSNSARGLLRRVYWLQRDNAKFSEAFAWQFSQRTPDIDVRELIDEMDNKLIPSLHPDNIKDPMLLAVADLIRLRQPSGGHIQLTLEQLQAQKNRFADQPDLYAYLLAAWHFYRDDAPSKTLDTLPAASVDGPLNTLTFSQETLRGLALEAQGELTAAQNHWTALLSRSDNSLQRAQLELALALNYERDGKLEKVFAKGSPISTAPIRERLLAYSASPDLLRQQADDDQAPPRERDTALYTLLYKNLHYADYQSFLDDLKRLPQPLRQARDDLDPGVFAWTGSKDDGSYSCPSLAQTAGQLAQDSNHHQATLCLGDFIRLNHLDGHWLNRQPAAGQLGSQPSRFEGSAYSRLSGYIKLIDAPQTSANDKAYALYRAIHCYAPSGYNSCDDQDISKDQRKQWFQTLKLRYAKTQWAQTLKYYW